MFDFPPKFRARLKDFVGAPLPRSKGISHPALLLLEGRGEEGATHAPDEGDYSLLHQLLLEEGEGATPVQMPDDFMSTRICTAALRLHASSYAIL